MQTIKRLILFAFSFIAVQGLQSAEVKISDLAGVSAIGSSDAIGYYLWDGTKFVARRMSVPTLRSLIAAYATNNFGSAAFASTTAFDAAGAASAATNGGTMSGTLRGTVIGTVVGSSDGLTNSTESVPSNTNAVVSGAQVYNILLANTTPAAQKLDKTNGVAQGPTLNNPTNTGLTTFASGATLTGSDVFSGAVIQDSTVNSNKFDANTRSMLGTGGSGVSAATATNIASFQAQGATNNLPVATISAGGASKSNLWVGAHSGNGIGLTNLNGTNVVGTLGIDNLSPVVLDFLSVAGARVLDPSPSYGADYWGGLGVEAAAVLTGTNYYVSPSGDSGNTGLTTASPWPLQYALDRVGPGITVTLMPGSYTNGYYDVDTRSGTPSNPAVVRSQYKWQAVLLNLTNNNGFNIYQCHNLVIDGLCISNSYSMAITVNGYSNTIANCWLVHSGHHGILSGTLGNSNNIVENSLVEWSGHGVFEPTNGLGWHPYGIYFSGPNNIIRNSVWRYNGSIGIHYYSGYAGEHQNNTRIYNNITYSNTRYGIYCANDIAEGVGEGTLPGTNYIVGNTVLDGVAVSFGTVYVSNNIIGPSGAYPTDAILQDVNDLPVLHNDYNLSTISFNGESGTTQGPHDIVTNYLGLANTNSGNFCLLSDSPARGAANTNVFGPVDFFGVAQTSVTDIGAFQYASSLQFIGSPLFSGAVIQNGTINSNKLDADTLALLGSGIGTGIATLNGSGTNTHLYAPVFHDQINGTNLPEATLVQSGIITTNDFGWLQGVPGIRTTIRPWRGTIATTESAASNYIVWAKAQRLQQRGFNIIGAWEQHFHTNYVGGHLSFNTNLYPSGLEGYRAMLHTNGFKWHVWLDRNNAASGEGPAYDYSQWIDNIKTVVDTFRPDIFWLDSEWAGPDVALLETMLRTNNYPIEVMYGVTAGHIDERAVGLANGIRIHNGADPQTWPTFLSYMDMMETNMFLFSKKQIYVGPEIQNIPSPGNVTALVLSDMINGALLFPHDGGGASYGLYSTITNETLLRIQGDSLMVCARRVLVTNGCWFYLKPLESGNHALMVVNTNTISTNCTIDFNSLNSWVQAGFSVGPSPIVINLVSETIPTFTDTTLTTGSIGATNYVLFELVSRSSPKAVGTTFTSSMLTCGSNWTRIDHDAYFGPFGSGGGYARDGWKCAGNLSPIVRYAIPDWARIIYCEMWVGATNTTSWTNTVNDSMATLSVGSSTIRTISVPIHATNGLQKVSWQMNTTPTLGPGPRDISEIWNASTNATGVRIMWGGRKYVFLP